MKSFGFIFWTLAAVFAFAACDPEEQDGGGQYTVTVTAGENGTASADKSGAAAGETVTITAVPDEGYAFSSWTVTAGTAVLADATAAETVFTMPAEDVEIAASFVEASAEIDDTQDILPSITDEAFLSYANTRMTSIEKIGDTTYPAWDQNGDGKLTAKEASEVAAMSLTSVAENLISVDALQYFTGLEVLLMDGAYNLESGQEYISKLPKLKVFNASTSNLGTLDFSNSPDLNTVVCDEAFLDAINVSSCTQLVELNLFYTEITGELDLTACTGLRTLDIGITGVTSLDVSTCSELQRLDAASADMLAHISLPQNSKITYLNFNNCIFPAEDLDLIQHPNLVYLSVSGNPNMTGIDLSNCLKLEQLICAGSPIVTLDLSHCPEIYLLWAWGCKLTSVDLSGCSKLFEIYLDHNNLTEIDASDCGFYTDEETGEETNTYAYHLGAQVKPGTEPYEDPSEGQVRHAIWAGLVVSEEGKTAEPQEVKIYLSQRHKEYWMDACGKVEPNTGYADGEELFYDGTKWVDDGVEPPVNLGHTNVIFLD